jgi:hypothetical protein
MMKNEFEASHIYMGNPSLLIPKVVSFHKIEPTS